MSAIKKPEFKFDINSLSLTPRVSVIKSSEDVDYLPPRVLYDHIAWQKIQTLVQHCTKEVGWFGSVKVVGSDYVITDIFVPEQTVTGTETDILPEALADIALMVEDPETLYYWGHSHVNMQVGPSGQDEEQTLEYLENVDVFIRGIYNKAGKAKVDVYDVEEMKVYECVENGPRMTTMSNKAHKEFLKLIDDNVKAYKPPLYQNNLRGYQGNTLVHQPTKYQREQALRQGSKDPLKNNPFILP